MNRVRIVALIAATLCVAVGAGTLFQQETMRQAEEATGAAPVQAGISLVGLAEAAGAAPVEPVAMTSASPVSVSASEPVSASPLGPVAMASVLPGMIDTAELTATVPRALDALLPAVTLTPQESALVAEPETVATDPAMINDLLAEVDACAVWLVVTPEVGAMMDMSLFAPCDGGALVQISHAGLNFDARMDGDGQLALRVPALAHQAELTVRFDDGRSASDATELPDAGLYDRVAIQWQGGAVLGLNAYEFGADFGSDNHIHPANPAAPGDVARGFLTELGETARVQVYSYPTGLSARTGQVALELEVGVTGESCERLLGVDTLEALAGADPVWREIQLEMPACDGQGGFLVLKNLLPELTIALN